MNIDSHQITVGGLDVEVVRKPIKNLHLGVYPPYGRVRVAAPLRVDDKAVRLAVVSKLAWVKRHRSRFAGQERQTAREYLTGESHYFQGARYRLNVIPHSGSSRVVLHNGSRMDLFVRSGCDRIQRKRVLLEWYRKQLKGLIPPLIAKWEAAMGVKVEEWGIKQMKTRWGTCNPRAKRIWINLELVKKPIHCLEFIVVHEMTHLLMRNHDGRFIALMNKFMPQWRSYREELNHTILSHVHWSY
jgi:predicted metal-dependent hydrolase